MNYSVSFTKISFYPETFGPSLFVDIGHYRSVVHSNHNLARRKKAVWDVVK